MASLPGEYGAWQRLPAMVVRPMPDPFPASNPVRQRLRAAWPLGRFAYQTLIAPWPAFAIFLVLIGIVGGLVQLGQIAGITRLVDTLAAQMSPRPVEEAASPVRLLAPYLPWLLLLVGMLILDRIIYYEPFHAYLAAQLNERVRERFDRLFYGKVLALRLEQFESATCYNAMERARALMDDNVADRLSQVQTLVAMVPSSAVILGALATVHWTLPLLLFLGSLPLIRWHIRRAQQVFGVTRAQTLLQR